MPRSYRLFVVAVGLALATHHPNLEARPKQEAPQERSANALESIAATYDKQAKGEEGSTDRRPCKPGDDQRNSDLCAQWKAADAAADSAWWAEVAGFASAISTLLVLIALYLAFRSNAIARDIAKRQLRAYVGISKDGIKREGVQFVARINIKNFGQTPAHNLRLVHQLTDNKLFNFDNLEQCGGVVHLDPGGEWKDNSARVYVGEGRAPELHYFAEITFTDIFDRVWRMRYHFYRTEKGGWFNHTDGSSETLLTEPRLLHLFRRRTANDGNRNRGQ